MLNVVLVTPDDPATGRSCGLLALMLADACVARGHRVHVVTAKSGVPRPSHTERGRLVVHRMSLRRPVKGADFAINACRHLHTLSRRGHCDVVEWIDPESSPLTWAAAAAAAHHGRPVPIIGVMTGATGAGPAPCHMTVNLDSSEGGGRCIPAPINPVLAPAPTVRGRAIIATDAVSPSEAERVVEAFTWSGVADLGWSLMLPDSSGDWATIGGGDDREPQAEGSRIALATGSSTPVACLQALSRGELSVIGHRSPLALHVAGTFDSDDIGSMAEALASAAWLSDEARRRRAEDTWASLSSRHAPADVAAAHEALWDAVRGAPPLPGAREAWRALEHAACMEGSS